MCVNACVNCEFLDSRQVSECDWGFTHLVSLLNCSKVLEDLCDLSEMKVGEGSALTQEVIASSEPTATAYLFLWGSRGHGRISLDEVC